jgi:hypothetical protein
MAVRLAFYLLLALCASSCAPTNERNDARVDTGIPLRIERNNVRTDEEIQAIFDWNKSKLYSVYQRFLRNDPTLKGRIMFQLRIEPSGQVSACSKHEGTTLRHPALTSALCAKIQFFDFGPKNMDAMTITYPIDFFPA